MLTKNTVRLCSLISGQLRPHTTREVDVLQHSAPASPLRFIFFFYSVRERMLSFSLSALPASNRETSKGIGT